MSDVSGASSGSSMVHSRRRVVGVETRLKKKKKREWSSVFVVVESWAVKIDREISKNEVVEEVIMGEL